MSQQWIEASGFSTWNDDPLPRLYTVNGDPIHVYGGYQIDVGTRDIWGKLRTVSSYFCAVDIAGSVDLILGLLWLVSAKPIVNWAEGHFTWLTDGEETPPSGASACGDEDHADDLAAQAEDAFQSFMETPDDADNYYSDAEEFRHDTFDAGGNGDAPYYVCMNQAQANAMIEDNASAHCGSLIKKHTLDMDWANSEIGLQSARI